MQNLGLSFDDVTKIFGVDNLSDVFKDFTPVEAAAKIKEWEDEEIRVNDEVTSNGMTVVVTKTRCDPSRVYVLWENGSCRLSLKSDFTKTGRTIDVQNILDQLSGK